MSAPKRRETKVQPWIMAGHRGGQGQIVGFTVGEQRGQFDAEAGGGGMHANKLAGQNTPERVKSLRKSGNSERVAFPERRREKTLPRSGRRQQQHDLQDHQDVALI